MVPPAWVLNKLVEIEPSIRLGWDGTTFVLIQIMHRREPAASDLFGTPWDNAGPVYGPHFDPVEYLAKAIKDVSVQDVMSGHIIDRARWWTRAVAERLAEIKRKEEAEIARERRDRAEAAADKFHWGLQHAVDALGPVAPEAAKAAEARAERELATPRGGTA